MKYLPCNCRCHPQGGKSCRCRQARCKCWAPAHATTTSRCSSAWWGTRGWRAPTGWSLENKISVSIACSKVNNYCELLFSTFSIAQFLYLNFKNISKLHFIAMRVWLWPSFQNLIQLFSLKISNRVLNFN